MQEKTTVSANKSIFRVPVYPFLIALAPVISLYMLNTLELGFYDLVRPALVSLIIAFSAFLVSWLVTKSIRSAAILGSILIISVLSYDFAFTSVLTWSGAENPDWIFLPAWLVLTGTVYIALASVLRRSGNSRQLRTGGFTIGCCPSS